MGLIGSYLLALLFLAIGRNWGIFTVLLVIGIIIAIVAIAFAVGMAL